MKYSAFILALLLLVSPVHASTIFSDDFEWGSDWNSSMNATLPKANGWGTPTMQNRGGSYEAAYINSSGAKSGSRGFIQYWDTTEGSGAQDIWLNHGGGNGGDLSFPDEYYVGYWFKVDPEWDWGSVQSLKIIKTNFNDGVSWDINWITAGNTCAYCCGDAAVGGLDDWCVVDGTRWTGDTSALASIMTDEAAYSLYGNWNEINDGNWHYFVWHMKHSTNTLSLSVDGVDAFQMSANQWPPASSFDQGVNGGTTGRWNFGGNITNGGGGKSEMWTAYDDLIIATTRAEVEDFLGVSGALPAPPTLSNVTISNGSFR